MAPKDCVSGGQRFLFRSKYDSSYATFTPTLAYLWYLVRGNSYIVPYPQKSSLISSLLPIHSSLLPIHGRHAMPLSQADKAGKEVLFHGSGIKWQITITPFRIMARKRTQRLSPPPDQCSMLTHHFPKTAQLSARSHVWPCS